MRKATPKAMGASRAGKARRPSRRCGDEVHPPALSIEAFRRARPHARGLPRALEAGGTIDAGALRPERAEPLLEVFE